LELRLLFQRGGHDGQDGRDARAGRKADPVQRARPLDTKRPSGGITQRVAGLELRGRPVGKHAALHRADAHFQLARGWPGGCAGCRWSSCGARPGADDGGAQGQELAGLEVQRLAQACGTASVMDTAPAASGLTRAETRRS
jgi:hypothetical protein